MELGEILSRLSRHKIAIVVCTIIGTTAMGVASLISPVIYLAEQDIYVSYPNKSIPSAYSYDGFYAQQTAKDLTETIVGLYQSKQFLANVADSAEYSAISPYLNNLKAKKLSTNLIRVSLRGRQKEIAKEKVTQINEEMASLTRSLLSEYSVIVKPVSTKVIVRELYLPLGLSLLGGGLLGLVLGVALAIFWPKKIKITKSK